MSESKMGLPACDGTRFFVQFLQLLLVITGDERTMASTIQKYVSNRLLIIILGFIFSCCHNPSLLKKAGLMWGFQIVKKYLLLVICF